MRRLVLSSLVLLGGAAAAQAQPVISTATNIVTPGTSVSVTVTGPAGQSFAVIGSITNAGFSYAGVDLAVGPDVAILTTGVIPGGGSAVVAVTPPFPANDRYYIQAATSATPSFATITPSNSVVLINNQEARLYMPIGGIVQANGTLAFGTPGITITKGAVGVYTINHAGFFALASAIPNITPTGNVFIQGIQTNSNSTVVTLSGDATFFFTVQAVRR